MITHDRTRGLPESQVPRRFRLDREHLPPTLLKENKGEDSGYLRKNLADMKSSWLSAMTQIGWEPQWAPNLGAGLTTAAVAIPLNVALAVSAGLAPSIGLFSGAIAGVITGLFGGSEFQVSGPAAALNMMVFAIAQKFGVVGVAAAAILSGIIQIAMGLFGLGKLMRFIPEAVLIGFTTGVGLKLLDTQIPILFGINIRVDEMFSQFFKPVWLFDVVWHNFICGALVILAVMFGRSHPRVPASVLGIGLSTQLALYLGWDINKIGEIPNLVFSVTLPTLLPSQWGELLALAVPLALLSGVESLLSAQAIDRITAKQHNSSLELWGQGLGNLLSGFMGGMPTSGVIVRSNVNIQSGGRNRLSAIIHGVILLGSAMFLAGILRHIPSAALAGLLAVVGFRLLEFKEFFHLLVKNKIHWIGFVSALIGTLTNHLIWGLGLGIFFILFVEWIQQKMTAGQSHPLGRKTKVEHKGQPDKRAEEKTMAAKLGTAVQTHISSEIRAEIRQGTGGTAGKAADLISPLFAKGENWLKHVSQSAFIPSSSFVHPSASVIGRVVLGRHVHIAAESSVRADEGTPFYIGDYSNIQDGVVIHALKAQWVRVDGEEWAVYIGKHVSVAHQALIHGPCFIGDNSFVGFKAVIHNSTIGEHCYIGIGATVVGVSIPNFKYVPHGAVIDSEEKVRTLDPVSEHHLEFNHDVVEVNRGLVAAYSKVHSKNSPSKKEQ